MNWLSEQLVFKSNGNFPVNHSINYIETKNEKQIEKKNNEKNFGLIFIELRKKTI